MTFVEDLCPKCLELALSSIFRPDLDDDALYAMEVLEIVHEDTEIGL